MILKLFGVVIVLLFSVLHFAFFVTPVDAAVGINNQINFQGKLVDNNGLNVADSTYTVVFSLYSVSSSGTAIWTESDSVTTTAGIFQVPLGAVTTLPANVDFNSDSLYLGIKVGADAEMTPRIRFTAVPYAFNAAKLDGVVATQSATGFNLQGGTSSLSTASFTTTGGALLFQPGVAEGLTVQSNGANGLTLDTGGGAAVSIGTGNATSVAFGKGSNNTSFTFNNGSGGFIVNGTGTVTLANLATANGLIFTSGTNGVLSQTAPSGGSQCLQSNSGNSALAWVACSSVGTNLLQLNTGALSPANITNDFLLGSTATISAKFAFINTVGAGTPTASISAQSGTNSALVLGANNTIQSVNAQTLTFGGNTTGDIAFKPGNIATPSLYLASNGFVGIGTTAPTQKLELAASGNIQLNSGIIQDYNDLTLKADPAGGNNRNIRFVIGGSSEVARFTESGLVGINTTSPLGVLDVRGVGTATLNGTIPVASTSGKTSFAAAVIDQSGSGDIFTASSAGLTKFVINNAGNVGIGTTTPTSTLTVAGKTATFNSGQDASLSSFSTNSIVLPNGANGGIESEASVTANGYIYVIGGIDNIGNILTTAYYAKLNNDGSTGTWVATSGLPAGRFGGGASILNGYVYYIGGDINTSGTASAIVYYAKINSDGTLGTWASATSLPGAVGFSGVTAANGYLYSVSGLGGSDIRDVYYAKPNTDGTISNWIDLINSLPLGQQRDSFGLVVANGYMYAIGGEASTNALATVYSASLNPTTGALGTWTATTSLPTATGAGVAAVGNGNAYYIGGSTGIMANVTQTMYYASFTNNGAINSWNTVTSALPAGRTVAAGAQANGYIYVLGGDSTNATASNHEITSVYYASTARVSIDANLDLLGLSTSSLASASGSMSGGGAGGSIYAGNIFSNGGLEVSGNTQLWNGLSINGGESLWGGLNIASAANGITPIASLSGKTSFAGLVVNNSGSGDLFTASASGLTKFLVSNSGSVLFKGDVISSSSSAVLTNNGSGSVENELGDEGSLVPNAGFEANIAGSSFADGWVVSATTSAAVTRDTAVLAKGAASARVTLNNATAAFYSACMPLTGVINSVYTLNYYAKANAGAPTVRAYIDGYATKTDCNNNKLIQAPVPVTTTAITTSWVAYGSKNVAIPNTSFGATMTFGRIHFFVATAANTFINIDGVRLIQIDNQQGLDFAEDYPADPNNIPQPGQVVSLLASGSAAIVTPSNRSMDPTAIGVVSTNPGEVLDDGSMTNPVPVALAGRVPVNVSTINGVIHVGDYLASSRIPGVAMKATRAGQVIGTAMEDDTDSDTSHVTQVTMFIKNTYYNGGTESSTSGLSFISDAQDSSVLLQLLQGTQSATSSALSDVTNGNVVNGLSLLLAAITKHSTRTSTDFISSDSAEFHNNQLTVNGLTVTDSATVSADLHVKGNGLIEGILHIADTLFANKFIVNGISDFFGKVIFHSGVTFNDTPVFDKDTAGFAVISKDADHVVVKFSKPYDQTPIINASITLNPITPTPSETLSQQQERESLLENAVLKNIHYIIINRTTKGFTILLDEPAAEDISFSWVALAVNSPVIFQSNGQNIQLPTPTQIVSPSPIDTIIPPTIPVSPILTPTIEVTPTPVPGG